MDRTEMLAGVEFVRGVMEYHRDRLSAGHDETADEAAAWDEGARFIDEQTAQVRRVDERDAQLARAAEFLAAHPDTPTIEGDGVRHAPNINTRGADDPFDLSTLSVASSPSQIRGQARTALERISHADDAAVSAAADTLDRFDDASAAVAQRYLITGSEAYRTQRARRIGIAFLGQAALDEEPVDHRLPTRCPLALIDQVARAHHIGHQGQHGRQQQRACSETEDDAPSEPERSHVVACNR